MTTQRQRQPTPRAEPAPETVKTYLVRYLQPMQGWIDATSAAEAEEAFWEGQLRCALPIRKPAREILTLTPQEESGK